MTMKQVAVAVLAMTATAGMFAQTTNPAAATGQSIGERKVEQQQRIGQGVRSGELTRGETRHLEHQERAINHEERAMRAQDNGHLTRADKKVLTRQQNAESRRIYRDKHNARVR